MIPLPDALLLLLVQRREPDEPDWVRWIVVALFFGFPLLARLVRGLLVHFGLAQPEPAEGDKPAHRAPGRAQRAERRKAEDEGEELWRRLARGEVAEVPAAPVPVPASEARPRADAEPGSVLESALPETSLEGSGEPQPLSVMGDVSEPGEAPETSLERELEPAPLAILGDEDVTRRLARRGEAEGGAEPAPRPRVAFALARGDLRRAVILTEVLGPPVSQRS